MEDINVENIEEIGVITSDKNNSKNTSPKNTFGEDLKLSGATSTTNKSVDEINDPFRVRLSFTPLDNVKMVVIFLFLVPIRVVVALSALIMAWAVSCIGLVDIDQTAPVSGWRKPLQKISCFFGRVCCRCCGFSVTMTGVRVSKKVAPVLVTAPHSSFFDALAIFWTESFIVNREENKDLLLIGKCVQFAQAIFVSRESKESREACKDEIKRRVNSSDDWGQFMIFPEGTTSNRKALMSFKPGGFLPGKAVQPVLIKYNLTHDTVSWTWDQPHGFVACFLFTICQWSNPVELQFLPPYVPSQEEKEDPMLFANNVRKVMSDALQVPMCDMTFEDIKNKYSKKKKDE